MIQIDGIDHVGLRVSDAGRAQAFYELLGFEFVWKGGEEPVVVLRNASGVELNLIVNAGAEHAGKNVLMDVPDKFPGYTHVALRVESIERTVAELGRLGIAITGGPVKLGEGTSLFVRDPDRNVVELRAKAPAR